MGGSLSLGQGNKRFSQLHGVRYKSNSSLLGSTDTKGEYDPRYFDYQTAMSYRFSDKVSASFLGNISVNRYLFTPVNRTTNFGTSSDAKQFTVYFDGHEKDRFETYFGALSLDYRVNRGTNLQLLASGYLTNELVAYDISGEYWLNQAGTSDVGGELGVGRFGRIIAGNPEFTVFEIIGQVLLIYIISGVVMRILIPFMISKVAHKLCGRVSEVKWYRTITCLFYGL